MIKIPIGPYKDFAECVSKNKGKKNPKAYCGFIENTMKKARANKSKMSAHADKVTLPDESGKCKEGFKKMGDYCYPKDMKKEDMDEVNKMFSPKESQYATKMVNDNELEDIPTMEGKKETSVFTEDKVNQLSEIVNKLEKVETIEAAKLLVPEFKSFVSGVSPQPAPKETPAVENKGEPAPSNEPKAETKPADQPNTAEQPKADPVAKPNESTQASADNFKKQLIDALDLNKKMLDRLKKSNETIMTLENINDKFKSENSQMSAKVSELEKSISVYVEKEKLEKKTKHDSILGKVVSEYCDFMGVPKDERIDIEKQMSTFSDDMLTNTLKYLQKKSEGILDNQPSVMTKPSSELNELEDNPSKEISQMTAQEKTDYLFSKIQKIKKGRIK